MKKSKLDKPPITLACVKCRCVWDGRLSRWCTCGKLGVKYLSDKYWNELKLLEGKAGENNDNKRR